MTRRIQSSISAWLSDGTGGVRVEIGLRDFSIVAGYPSAMAVGSGTLGQLIRVSGRIPEGPGGSQACN
jgi:hypothetical protein